MTVLDDGFIRYALQRTADEAAARGMPRIELRGQLIRPVLAFAAAARADADLSPEFWKGALAIQLAHEASLVHDDIVDESSTRRGQPTAAAKHGIARALVLGDHLLTAGYRLAAETGSIHFASLFARSVERTVAGEMAQSRSLGRTLSFTEYRQIAEAKAGELLGCSLALGAAIENPARIEVRSTLGRSLGLMYQMLDDLLDYCPLFDTGKPPLGDFSQRRWTWPLLEISEFSFDDDAATVRHRMREAARGPTVLGRCILRLEAEASAIRRQLREEFGNADVGESLIDLWLERARSAVASEEAVTARHPAVTLVQASPELKEKLPQIDDVVRYLSINSRSFRFASRFFPPAELGLVANVYTFCRVTDDIVDRPDGSDAAALLDEWMRLARSSYLGSASNIAFLDRAMQDMASRDVPFDYAAHLADGMRMDLRGETYASVAHLREYTYRVASVVGLWLTELAGVRSKSVLARAECLGHAMQLTNILRDVGEDAMAGRLYLPLDRMRAHGVSRDALFAACKQGTPMPRGYASLVEELLQVAERDYASALEAVRDLPPGFQRPVAVAAHVYRGIHGEIRRNSYDNLKRRAVTSTPGKAMLAAKALWTLRAATPARMAPA